MTISVPSAVDILIVGAGPAGLSAALYATRSCRSTLVVHDEASRAARIPVTHNVPGFEEGIRGAELLARLQRHAERYGAKLEGALVTHAARVDDRFELAGADGQRWSARALILATGVVLNQIPIDEATHEAALELGVLRYCPICDGFEHRGERIAVVGFDGSGAAEAIFLSGYTRDVTLLPRHDVELTDSERCNLEAAGIATIATPISHYAPVRGAMKVFLKGEISPLTFDIMFPGLGVRPRNELATMLGLAVNDVGNVSRESPFETAVPGLFCAGDIADGLDQISVAMGHGALAATRAHNWLREQDGATAESVLEHPPSSTIS